MCSWQKKCYPLSSLVYSGVPNGSVLCYCDNEDVVHIINSGICHDPTVMGSMCCLYFNSSKGGALLTEDKKQQFATYVRYGLNSDASASCIDRTRRKQEGKACCA